MVALHKFLSPTIEKIYQQRESTQSTQYIETIPTGMAGDRCLRAMWYDFRFCEQFGKDAIALRSDELHKSIKAMVINELSSVGCHVSEVDQRNGKPWSVSEYAGHLTGVLDGIVESGIDEAPSKPHVLKVITIGVNQFSQVKTAGMEKAMPYHFAGVQVDMLLIDIDRTFVVFHCNDNGELFAERVKLDQEKAKFFIDRTGQVLTSDSPPVGISDNKESSACKTCYMKDVCHNSYMVKPTCRSCVHATCEMEKGGWSCSKWNCAIPFEGQIQGCGSHLYNPCFMQGWEVIDANDSEQWVRYKQGDKELTNAVDKKHGYTSSHLYSCPPELIDDANIFELMGRFDAEVVK